MIAPVKIKNDNNAREEPLKIGCKIGEKMFIRTEGAINVKIIGMIFNAKSICSLPFPFDFIMTV